MPVTHSTYEETGSTLLATEYTAPHHLRNKCTITGSDAALTLKAPLTSDIVSYKGILGAINVFEFRVADEGLYIRTADESNVLQSRILIQAQVALPVIRFYENLRTRGIYPETADYYDLGTPTAEWKNLYIGTGKIYFGTAQDVKLYNAGLNILKTDGHFYVVGHITVDGNVDGVDIAGFKTIYDAHDHSAGDPTQVNHANLTNVLTSQHHTKTTSGEIDHGSILGLTDDDHTQYWRTSTGRTSHLIPGDADARNLGSTSREWANLYIGSGKMYFGIAQDVNLYRGGANQLRTDDDFYIAGALTVVGNISTSGNVDGLNLQAFWTSFTTHTHPGGDVDHGELSGLGDDDHSQYWLTSGRASDMIPDNPNLRDLGGVLKEWKDIYLAGKVYFGLTSDVNLYRSVANVLRTDDNFSIYGNEKKLLFNTTSYGNATIKLTDAFYFMSQKDIYLSPSVKIRNLTNPVNNQDAATKAYVIDAIGELSGAGWFGSSTRIKIIPKDFVSSSPTTPEYVIYNGAYVLVSGYNDLVATKPIPIGFKATHVRVYASTQKNVYVYEGKIDDATGTAKGSGNTSAEINITDVTSSTTNYLVIRVDDVSGAQIRGGYITITTV